MLLWSAIFFVIAVIAALFGFSDIAAGAADIGRALFALFLIQFVLSAIAGLARH